MTKKRFEEGLEKLFSDSPRNITITEPEVVENKETEIEESEKPNQPKRGRPALNEKIIRFCTMADEEKVAKIRTIAAREGLPIKDLMNLAFSKLIKEYEEKYGIVRIPKNKKGGDLSKIFDL